ncbi:hypothetical protein HF1_09490 [Mycoplasma haemofelis str. Langford 1]|uniref:Uncharacterized protein n=1 Tax=Mycoplasma haemofelis (strain Langford 1) TaxID=941640 RepID=E8ZII6_MYCHL|nr:hypothetical protein [Mycoplasma haemofelis]CBY92957.1 hypothetical protein HF1_09490 [Mycoplasma haemofelis str. Langford 1]
MNVATKASIALAGTAGATGGGVFMHKLINRNTISKNINPNHLLKANDADKWSHRVQLLKTASEEALSKDLLSKKNKKFDFSSDDLKKWCFESLETDFLGKEDKKFQNVVLYCGINMGDKITGTKVDSSTETSNAKLGENFTKLKNKTQDQLISELFSIKDQENSSSTWAGGKALKEWCIKALNVPFEEGLTFDNAKDYCVITNP